MNKSVDVKPKYKLCAGPKACMDRKFEVGKKDCEECRVEANANTRKYRRGENG